MMMDLSSVLLRVRFPFMGGRRFAITPRLIIGPCNTYHVHQRKMMSNSWYLLLVISSIHKSLCPFGELDLELRLGPGTRCESSQQSLASAPPLSTFHEQSYSRDGPQAHIHPDEENESRAPTARSTKGKEWIDSSPDSPPGKRKRVPGPPSEEGVPEVKTLVNTIYAREVMFPFSRVAAPVIRPYPLQIISLAPVEAKGVPKVLPSHSWQKKVTVLSISWIYGQNLASRTSEILAFRHEGTKINLYSKLAEIATTIQGIVDSMKLAFGEDMPVHPLFSEYGTRVFPELIAMYSKGMDEKAILNSQKHLLRKWTYVIDYIRLQNRSTLYKFLLTFEPAIELLDALIRANWDAITLDNFIRDLWIFSRCRVGNGRKIALEDALTRLDWFVKNFVSSANRIAFPKRTSVENVSKIYDIIVRDEEAYTVFFQEPNFVSEAVEGAHIQSLEQSSSRKPEAEAVQEEQIIRSFSNYIMHFTGKVRTRQMEINKVRVLDRLYQNGERHHPSTAVLEAALKLKSIEKTQLKDLCATINAKLTQIEIDLEIETLGSTKDKISVWDTSFLETVDPPVTKQHERRFRNALGAEKLQSKEFKTFLYMLSSQKDDKMTYYSFVKVCEVFALSHTLSHGEKGLFILLAELLPMLILGNHPYIPNQTLRYKPTLRHIREYVYLHSEDNAHEQQRYVGVRRTLGDLYWKVQGNYIM